MANPTKTDVPSERVAHLREYLQQAVDAGYFAGVTSCVVQRGKVLQRDAFGFRDVEDRSPMTNDTIFRIASSTKPIIAAAMLVLYDEGRWKLDDPVAKFIPEFGKLKVREKDGSIVDPVPAGVDAPSDDARHWLFAAAGARRGQRGRRATAARRPPHARCRGSDARRSAGVDHSPLG